MWENPLSLWIRETVCIMFMGGEGGMQKRRGAEREDSLREDISSRKGFLKAGISSFWIEAVDTLSQ